MKLKLYSIRDNKSGVYQAPSHAVNDVVVMRSLQTVLREGNNLLSRYPGEFDLYQVAEFDDESGTAMPLPQGNRHVCTIAALVPSIPEPTQLVERLEASIPASATARSDQ